MHGSTTVTMTRRNAGAGGTPGFKSTAAATGCAFGDKSLNLSKKDSVFSSVR